MDPQYRETDQLLNRIVSYYLRSFVGKKIKIKLGDLEQFLLFLTLTELALRKTKGVDILRQQVPSDGTARTE